MEVKLNAGPQAAESAPAAAPRAPGIVYVTDSRGRRIGLKKPTPGDRFELDDCIVVKTQPASTQVTVVGCLFSIDDEAFTPLWTYEDARSEFKKRLEALGDEGLQVIGPAVMAMFGLDKKAVETAKNS